MKACTLLSVIVEFHDQNGDRFFKAHIALQAIRIDLQRKLRI
jgi:hypothetical protein